MKKWLICAALLASAMPALADRDFLTSDEIEKVRDAQEPNERLKLYVVFARQRVDQLQRLLEKEKKGRSLLARQLLEDYTNIIDAMDTVSDDALKRGADIAVGQAAMREAENRMLTELQKIKDRNPSDIDLYSVDLTEALAATSDSLDLSKEDDAARATELEARDKKAKSEAEQVLRAEQNNGKPGDPAAANQAKGDVPPTIIKPERKPPTLYRPGEKHDDQQ